MPPGHTTLTTVWSPITTMRPAVQCALQRIRRFSTAPLGLGAAALLFGVQPASADPGDVLSFGIGGFAIDHSESAWYVEGQFQFAEALRGVFRPVSGFMLSTEDDVTAYAGLSLPIDIGPSWMATPVLALGVHHDGDTIDLGHTLQFYRGLQVEYRLNADVQIGAKVFYLSNLGLGDDDPGAYALALTYGLRY